MGLGDGKLALGIGWLLGIKYGFSAIVFAFWIGAVISLIVMIGVAIMKFISRKINKRRNKIVGCADGKCVDRALQSFGESIEGLSAVRFKSEIPFAPFLVIGLLIVFFLNISVMDFLAIFTS